MRNTTSRVKIEATSHPSATIDPSNAIGPALSDNGMSLLDAGMATNINVVVQPEDESGNGTYTIRVYRENSPRSGDKGFSTDTDTVPTLVVHASTDEANAAVNSPVVLAPTFDANPNASHAIYRLRG